MQTYKFQTKVSGDGSIQIPNYQEFRNLDVDVVITKKIPTEQSKISADEFIRNVAGVLSDKEIDTAKLDYLLEKYK